MLMDDVRGEVVLRRLPKSILDSLSLEQIGAIRRAGGGGVQQRRHPIDARFNLRLPLFGGFYLVTLIGKELRSPARRAFDRDLRPADRISRAAVVVLCGAALALAALVGILFENSLIVR